jgi:tetratricopeptide (TPR) repeat protein
MKLSVFPRDLCLDYLWPPSVHPGEIVPPMIFLSLLGLGTVWAVWRRRAVGFLGVWFFVILAPTSSFMPLGDAAFEHRMYLPLAAIVVLLVVGGYLLLEKIVRYCRSARCIALIRTAEIAGIVGLLSLLVFTTIQRNEVYRSNEAMWRDVLAKSHKNVRAMTALIDSLLTKAEYREAEDLSRRLLEQIEADRKPNPSGYILCMASFYSSAAHNQLGFALLSQGRASDAITHLRHVILVSSNDVIARHNLGLAFWLVGRKDEAIQELDIALNMAPDSGTIHTLMAYFLSWSGRHGEAIKHGRRAIEIDAGDIAAGVQLAWLLATCPDDKIRNGAEALALAESICKQTDHQSVRALDVLAAAYAETGRFDDAVATARCAMKLASERIAAGSDVSDVVGEIGAQADRAVELGAIGRRIELYEKGKPFREP